MQEGGAASRNESFQTGWFENFENNIEIDVVGGIRTIGAFPAEPRWHLAPLSGDLGPIRQYNASIAGIRLWSSTANSAALNG